jgi:hypothetical protein
MNDSGIPAELFRRKLQNAAIDDGKASPSAAFFASVEKYLAGTPRVRFLRFAAVIHSKWCIGNLL